MKKAIYAGSFDPPTGGHLDIINRSAKMVDKLIIGIGINPDKNYLFNFIERQKLLKSSIAHLDNIEIKPFQGLLVDFALREGVSYIIRGIRNGKDSQEELTLAQINHHERPGIESLLLPARQNMLHISSSAAKALQKEQGNVHDYVHLSVKHALEAKISGQYFIAITGVSGSGKTYLSKAISQYLEAQHIAVLHISLDKTGHEILTPDLDDPIYQNTRKKIIAHFGRSIVDSDARILRKKLGAIVFNDQQQLDVLNQLMEEPLLLRLRDSLYHKKGLILLDAALIAEARLSYVSNNNVVIMQTPKEVLHQRLSKRDALSEEQINRRIDSQFSYEKKKKLIGDVIDEDNYGQILSIAATKTETEKLASQTAIEILQTVDIYGELRITSLFSRLKDPLPKNSYLEVCNYYSRSHTPYHCLFHIIHGLDLLYQFQHLISEFDSVLFAWLYHDAVYDPRLKNNEEKSALLAEEKCQAIAFEGSVDTITELILATKHVCEPKSTDEAILMDVDLAIFAADSEQFNDYEKNIRLEYQWVPSSDYTEKRKQLLQQFLDRKNIYHTPAFRALFEDKARENIQSLL